MIKFGVLEDEIEQSNQLMEFIQRFQRELYTETCVVDTYQTGEALLEKFCGQYDILLLDIQLPDMLGIETAQRIREQDENVIIIFVTNLAQYAIDGYSVRAFDYVLKPLLYDAFAAKMKRVVRILEQNRASHTLTLKSKQEIWYLQSSEIAYIESMGHDLIFHTKDSAVTIWGTLSVYEKELKDFGFSRCSASYLVNLGYVEHISSSQITVNGVALPIGKTRRRDFLTDFMAYKGGNT